MEAIDIEKKQWWRKRRFHYNKGLVIAGITAFMLYAILGSLLIAPYDFDFEITLFTIVFQGIGYLFMMGVANLFYNLGYAIDKQYNTTNSEGFRISLYKKGYWFSFWLPFLIPVMVVIVYFVQYAGKPVPVILP
ncbi:hypothetical protein HQ865_18015 [Mucilaginibacter mali]|uniref:Uncharacterized protein n=1 Tax=Mucilaginibacter mali TaxID=2740462 RepID=A0A7D4UC96_9SPHI|nr:hypothetical protein [Mucilaginibacter mali]QKJ31578.1 hypothetical protein HQ865_18015 [Mucilaginibacter mali]